MLFADLLLFTTLAIPKKNTFKPSSSAHKSVAAGNYFFKSLLIIQTDDAISAFEWALRAHNSSFSTMLRAPKWAPEAL
jgi:hypothetical protein